MIYIAFFGWGGSNKFKQAELLLFMHAYWELLHTYNCAKKKTQLAAGFSEPFHA